MGGSHSERGSVQIGRDSDPKVIFDRARSIEGHRPSEFIEGRPLSTSSGNKGMFGQLIESHLFGIPTNADPNPDFTHAGIELKTCPLKVMKGGHLRVKERMVLGIIDFNEIVGECFEDSSLLRKNGHILMVFYLHDPTIELWDQKIDKVIDWDLESETWSRDLPIIRRDWQIIRDKVASGRAHELSEGDTFYLGACTKGRGHGKDLRCQPFSDVDARQRAFSLRIPYLTSILYHDAQDDTDFIIKDMGEYRLGIGFEDIVRLHFQPYIGLSTDEIEDMLGLSLNRRAKSYHATLARRMMGVKGSKVAEFERADIQLKVIRLKRNGMPKEDMSFKAFKYMDIVNQTWEGSDLRERLCKKFFFMIFRIGDDKVTRLEDVMFWNMPYLDLLDARDTWEETVRRIRDGRADDLPKKSETRVIHVRPHGRNSKDTCPTPDGREIVKKSFWLNAPYLRGQIDHKLRR